MDWKVAAISFGIVFLAELGDKTQLAALALTGKTGNPLSVFIGAGAALLAATVVGVAAGAALQKMLPERAVEIGSAILFIGVGGFLLVRAIFFSE
jgi:putative Ca2+/H+ antiporter (TMEM165/GDT1 family)